MFVQQLLIVSWLSKVVSLTSKGKKYGYDTGTAFNCPKRLQKFLTAFFQDDKLVIGKIDKPLPFKMFFLLIFHNTESCFFDNWTLNSLAKIIDQWDGWFIPAAPIPRSWFISEAPQEACTLPCTPKIRNVLPLNLKSLQLSRFATSSIFHWLFLCTPYTYPIY